MLAGDARAQLSKGRKDLAPSLDGRALPDLHAPTDAPSARPSLHGNGKLRSNPWNGVPSPNVGEVRRGGR